MPDFMMWLLMAFLIAAISTIGTQLRKVLEDIRDELQGIREQLNLPGSDTDEGITN